MRVTFVRALVSEPWHSGGAKICQALRVWRSDLGNQQWNGNDTIRSHFSLPFAHFNGQKDQQDVVLELWRLIATARGVWVVAKWVTANINTALE